MKSNRLIYFVPPGRPSFDEAVAQGIPTVETPFQNIDPNHFVITQTYMQRAQSYKKPEQNSRMPRDIMPNLGIIAYHMEDGPTTPTGVGDIITFNRVFATIPKTINEEDKPFLALVPAPKTAKLRSTSIYHGVPSPLFSWGYYFTNFGVVGGGFQNNYLAYNRREFYLVGLGQLYIYESLIPQLEESTFIYKDWTSLPLNTQYREDVWDSLVFALPTTTGTLSSGYTALPFKTYQIPNQTVGSSITSETVSSANYAAGNYIYGKSSIYKYIGNIWERRTIIVKIT